MKEIAYQTDWIGSNPVFYNEKTKSISNNINEVIDFTDIDIHPEGLNNYLKFGYSVLGQTPIKHVRFLRPNQSIKRSNNQLSIEQLDDPVEFLIHKTYKEEEIIEILKSRVRNWENSVRGEIIIPTSGGYDSRLLNFLIEDKCRIRSYTYGLSNDQSKSSEVIYAKKLSEILQTKWGQIQLGKFNNYIDEWLKLYGISTHAHGMYHLEFYKKIKEKSPNITNVLSGIIGDGWSGRVNITTINSADDVYQLGYSHGVGIYENVSRLKSRNNLINSYYEENKDKLKDFRWRIVEAMRMKMILLSYLIKVPNSLGFNTWSPFLDIEVAMGMLNLPENRRKNRQWQKDFFTKNNLNLEQMNLDFDSQNRLDLDSMFHSYLTPLKENLLKELIDGDFVRWVNKRACTYPRIFPLSLINSVDFFISAIPKISRVIEKLGFKSMNMKYITPYNYYLILKPIEYVLEKRRQ